jgi:hypothetical protein
MYRWARPIITRSRSATPSPVWAETGTIAISRAKSETRSNRSELNPRSESLPTIS